MTLAQIDAAVERKPYPVGRQGIDSAGVHVASKWAVVIALAAFAVLGPRSFSYTTSSVDDESHHARGPVQSGIGDGSESAGRFRQGAEVVAVERDRSVGARVCFPRDQRVADPDRRHFVLADSPEADFVRAVIRIESPRTVA